jgi:predicted RecA/RadA family phage recombinase
MKVRSHKKIKRMENYICEGDRIQNTAPAGGITSGDLHLIGSKVAVAMTTAAEGETYVSMTEGVFEVPKATGAITIGAKVYFDSTAKNVTTTASGNTLVGWAYTAAASGDATVQISINENV